MKQIDELVQTAAEAPDDVVARRVLSDALRAQEEYDLATAVESKRTGQQLMIRLGALSVETGLPVSFNLLWCAHFLFNRLGTALGVTAPAVTSPVPAPAYTPPTPPAQPQWPYPVVQPQWPHPVVQPWPDYWGHEGDTVWSVHAPRQGG